MTDLAAGIAMPAVASGSAAAAAAALTRSRLVEVMRDIEQRVHAGQATDDDARRYRMACAALSFHGSPARLPYLPAAFDQILAERRALTLEMMVSPEVAGPAITQ